MVVVNRGPLIRNLCHFTVLVPRELYYAISFMELGNLPHCVVNGGDGTFTINGV